MASFHLCSSPTTVGDDVAPSTYSLQYASCGVEAPGTVRAREARIWVAVILWAPGVFALNAMRKGAGDPSRVSHPVDATPAGIAASSCAATIGA